MLVEERLYLGCVMWHQERETNTSMCRWDTIIPKLQLCSVDPTLDKYSIWNESGGGIILPNMIRHNP